MSILAKHAAQDGLRETPIYLLKMRSSQPSLVHMRGSMQNPYTYSIPPVETKEAHNTEWPRGNPWGLMTTPTTVTQRNTIICPCNSGNLLGARMTQY